MDIAAQVGYTQARAAIMNYVERQVKRKNYLVQQQDSDPTSDRNKSLNLLEQDIGTLFAYLIAVDSQLAAQQAELDRLAQKVRVRDMLLRIEQDAYVTQAIANRKAASGMARFKTPSLSRSLRYDVQER